MGRSLADLEKIISPYLQIFLSTLMEDDDDPFRTRLLMVAIFLVHRYQELESIMRFDQTIGTHLQGPLNIEPF